MGENTLPIGIFISFFSAYTAHQVEYNGVLYATAEHAYHSARYADLDIQKEIREARSPFLAWQVSQKYKDQQIADFPERKREVMKEIFRVKCEQHADVRDALIASAGLQIMK